MLWSNFIDFLTSHVPIARWLLIIIMFGCALGCAYLMADSILKITKGD